MQVVVTVPHNSRKCCIDPKELWIGGLISQGLEHLGANVFPGVKSAVNGLKQVIAEDLQLSSGRD